MLEADRTFNDVTARDGADGWVSFFAEDGRMMVPGGQIQGLEAIRGAITSGLSDGGTLTWDPEWGEVAESGDLGFTVGRYESRPPGSDDPDAVSPGQYVTIWRKDVSGAWKVLLDIGAPDPARPETPGEG
jgi:ketosteroid isomerase-like protein